MVQHRRMRFLRIAGQDGRDAQIAAFAAAIHQLAGVPLGATSWRAPTAPVLSDRASPGEIELAVVGAHLSGMALNSELTSRGARFLRACEATADYRLYALPGGPPRRPGLLRVASNGSAIATEVWAVPEATFGSFVAGVPAPLGIGTTLLADGTQPKGFIVENIATMGAEDIAGWGGAGAPIVRVSPRSRMSRAAVLTSNVGSAINTSATR